jgi:hypothetical protein
MCGIQKGHTFCGGVVVDVISCRHPVFFLYKFGQIGYTDSKLAGIEGEGAVDFII